MTTSDASLDQFVLFDERNGYPFDPGFQYRFRVVERSHGVLPSNRIAATMDEARELVRIRLAKALEHSKAMVVGLQAQLESVDQLVVDPGPVSKDVRDHYEELVQVLRAYKEKPFVGAAKEQFFPYPQLGRLQVQLGYLSTPNLIVFVVPEASVVNHAFDDESIELILKAVDEAFPGAFRDTWNGVGLYTFSVRLPMNAMSKNKETEDAV